MTNKEKYDKMIELKGKLVEFIWKEVVGTSESQKPTQEQVELLILSLSKTLQDCLATAAAHNYAPPTINIDGSEFKAEEVLKEMLDDESVDFDPVSDIIN